MQNQKNLISTSCFVFYQKLGVLNPRCQGGMFLGLGVNSHPQNLTQLCRPQALSKRQLSIVNCQLSTVEAVGGCSLEIFSD
jgi:hypothetical protein